MADDKSTRPHSAIGSSTASRPMSGAPSRALRPRTVGTTKRKDHGDGEYDKLKNRYNHLQMNHGAFVEESANLIRKQAGTIEQIRKENELIKKDLELEARQARQVTVVNHKADVDRAVEEIQAVSARTANERQRHEELDAELNDLKARVLEFRERIEGGGGVTGLGNHNDVRLASTHKILENRLEKHLQKFNDALNHNKTLRHEIEELRRDKKTFDKIYSSLQNELTEKKREMARVIEMANESYEERDLAQQEIIQLKTQNNKEESLYEAESDQLHKRIAEDRDKRERIVAQSATPEAYEAEQKRKAQDKAVTAAQAARDKQREEINLLLQSYETSFNRIKEATDLDTADKIVAAFIDSEDRNFRLLKYLDELQTEKTKIEENIAECKQEIERWRGSNTDHLRKRILLDLEEKVKKAESKADQYEAKYNEAMQLVLAVKPGIEAILDVLEPGATAELYKDAGEGITEANVMAHLGMIEQRVTEILHAISTLDSAVTSGPRVPATTQQSTSVTFPNSEDFVNEDEEEDEEAHPLSHEELKSRILKRESADVAKNPLRPGAGRLMRPRLESKPTFQPYLGKHAHSPARSSGGVEM
eukprot:gnl/Hemi2/20706_TR6859_c0_g1_i1.p1 gnl/Hemi2/20706_TR6859_c0_g1~~gnl/Hemi2/20706_TR6859_c0_g1_i1.p1  ORF type:complete len:593 (-),score=128.81 gnl/Hemi2/20706_TR6859_c0_g1_i1:134-1912(-)